MNRLADDCDVVFSTHDPQDVAASCTEVLTLDKGISRYFGSVGVVTREHSISVADAYCEVLKLGTIMRDGS